MNMCLSLRICIMLMYVSISQCTISSKINGTRKGVYLPISKLHSILPIITEP